ncbi:MAG TPA: bacterioferritin [Planctomycetota bacterium]|nr:bacterioferritin [Planctomycetota bacterium]HRR81596.1 bacterioferritin [Planctomycetota bacterium]HRT94851.1 bacterioferritin [Planctomycetota bacterium]
MKGNAKVLEWLNKLLADELTAISQYMVHAEMAENWGYGKLGGHFQKRAIDEMKHAEKLIGRILFLEGKPVVSQLNEMHIGAEVPKMLANDKGAEMGAVKSYNEAIALCAEVRDNATKEMLDGILNDEDRHIDEIEERLDQIEQMTLPIFLTTQVG